MGADHVDEALAELRRALTPHVTRDWFQPAGELTWTCWATAVHIAHDLLAYAGQVAGRPADAYLPLDLTVPAETPPAEVLRVIDACGALLSSAITTADPASRAWHWGPTDPGGFAALGVDEILMHTHDITRGLGVDWRPPADLCASVLARLFPDAPPGDPADVLLWCTGRAELGDRPRLSSWTLKAALDS
ncbi:DinB family protein [Allocatelliglobosispora scoriae]|nr:DinB family protein [Allocatelliglobosispora scoriae]